MEGKWIWTGEGSERENERVCFTARFLGPAPEAVLAITAVTKYQVWLNGIYLCSGPMRAPKDTGYLDEYEIGDRLKEGENLLAIRVWSYGWSTYQSLAEPGGLYFTVTQKGECLAASDESVICARDAGHLSHAPKRNANLGFADYFDARVFDEDWTVTGGGFTAHAVSIEKEKKLLPRPIRLFHEEARYPARVLRVEDVEKNCRVFSINLRQALFPGRTDADETIMTGFLGCELESETEQRGRISFPNRSWNGILGTFRIGDTVYPVTDASRDVEVTIQKGRSLFLLRFSDKFDDLYCHLELRFEREVKVCGLGGDRAFFAIGPTTRFVSAMDGHSPITEVPGPLTEQEQALFACTTLSALQDFGLPLIWIKAPYVMEDLYLLSLARLARPVASYGVTDRYLGLLWNGSQTTVLDLPKRGDYRRMLVDFGDLYVGQLEFTLRASAGTILEIYGFENCYQGEIDFTIGLNNGLRYVCREGWQHFRGIARMGLRYALISVREASAPVELRDFHINYAAYAVSGAGDFACSDESLNRIWEMCHHTHRLCMEDSFTDCPTYEQAFWLGDAQTSAAVDHFLYGEYELVRHVCRLGASAAANTPLLNALTPTDWNTAIPMWTFNWLIAVTEYIQVTGDRSLLDDLYEPAREALLYYRGLLTQEGGLVVHAWNLIDWAHLDTPEGSVLTAYQGLLSCVFRRFGAYARELGRAEDEKTFTGTADRMQTFLEEHLWNEARQAYCDAWDEERGFSSTCSIQTHSLLYLFDAIRRPERREITAGYLREKPADMVDVGSPFMLYYYYEAKASQGEIGQVLTDIRRRWGEMLRYESTTCWEVFPGFYENSRTRSYCHAWSAAPAALMQKYLLGITQKAEGWKSIRATVPELPGENLTWCRGSIPTPFGPVTAHWNRETRQVLLGVPEEIEVTLDMPEDYSVSLRRTMLEA